MDNGGFWITISSAGFPSLHRRDKGGGSLTRRHPPPSRGPASDNVTTATLAPSGPLPQTIEAAISAAADEMC